MAISVASEGSPKAKGAGRLSKEQARIRPPPSNGYIKRFVKPQKTGFYGLVLPFCLEKRFI